MPKMVTIKISQSLAFLVSNAMKQQKDYNENSEFGKLQKELEQVGQLSDTIVEIERE